MNVVVAEAVDFERAQAFYQSVGYNPPLEPEARMVLAEHDGNVVGIVRIIEEQGLLVLRGMQVDPRCQRCGLGSRMLEKLVQVIGDRECYCLPHGWLEGFYGQIGFQRLDDEEVPIHLKERLLDHRQKYPRLIAMKRAM